MDTARLLEKPEISADFLKKKEKKMNLSEARRWQKFLPTPKFSNFIPKSTTKKNFMFLRPILEEKSNVDTELPNQTHKTFGKPSRRIFPTKKTTASDKKTSQL